MATLYKTNHEPDEIIFKGELDIEVAEFRPDPMFFISVTNGVFGFDLSMDREEAEYVVKTLQKYLKKGE